MRVMLRRLAVIAALTATTAHAQTPAIVTRATNSSITVDEGAVITAVFVLRNTTAESLSVTSLLDLPKGWTNVTGLAPRSLAPNATDTWIAGISVPAHAAAGRYVIRGSVNDGNTRSTDSVIVIVDERRAVEIVPIAVPAWTGAQSAYEATFLVRNRGNVASTVDLNGKTSRGTRATTTPSTKVLQPGATARVAVKVAMSLQTRTTTDDVIELEARIRGAADSAVVVSSRTTVVPDGRAGRGFESLPASLSIRSANGAAGVAPVALSGSGRINGTHTDIDFLLQTPTNQSGPVNFGEREEYRVSVKSDRFGVRLGDQVYGWSPLASSGVAGMGGEVRGSQGVFEGGAYAQRPRWSEGTKGEQGAFAGVVVDSTFGIAGVALARQTAAGIPVRVGALNSNARVLNNNVELEGAVSDSAGRGFAYRARIARTTDRLSYEAGYSKGDAGFAGPFGGWMSTGGSIAVQMPAQLNVAASAHVSEWGGRDSSTIAAGERHTTTTASLSWRGSATVEYGRLARRRLDDASDRGADQQGVRVTASQTFGVLSLTAGAERGEVRDNVTLESHPYTQGSLALSTSAGKFGSLGVSAIYNHGNTLTGLRDGIADVGVNTTLRLPFGFEIGVAGSARRATLGVLDSSGAWFSVMDARLDKRVTNGSVIGVHARTMQSPYTAGAASGTSKAVYLEYRRDVRVPVKRTSERGRIAGRVTNDDGTPLAGALVRLGQEGAVTDREGRVRFSGLESGQYRVSVEARGAAVGAMITGDLVVDVRDGSDQPREFHVVATRGATLTASVRSYVRQGSVGAASAELTDAGAVQGVLVQLAGNRDTLYQMSDAAGRVDFGTVAPGPYVLSARGDAPEHMKFERERIDIVLVAGERSTQEIRLVPRERTIRMIDAGAVKAGAPGRE